MLRRKAQTPTAKRWSEVPAGTFIETEHGYFYVYSPTRRYRIITRRVLESWAPHRVVRVSEDDDAVKQLKVVAKLKFRNGSLLYSQSDGKMYLVSDNKLRQINDPDYLVLLGTDRQAAVWVSKRETELHEIGQPLD